MPKRADDPWRGFIVTEPPLLNCWPLLPYVVAPVFLADVPARGAWNEILEAYGDWIARLGFLQGGAHGEGYAWMILIALISPAFAFSIILLLLKPGALSRRRARRRLS